MEHLGLAVIRAYDLGLSAGVWLGARGHGGRVGPSDTPYVRSLFVLINTYLSSNCTYFTDGDQEAQGNKGFGVTKKVQGCRMAGIEKVRLNYSAQFAGGAGSGKTNHPDHRTHSKS